MQNVQSASETRDIVDAIKKAVPDSDKTKLLALREQVFEDLQKVFENQTLDIHAKYDNKIEGLELQIDQAELRRQTDLKILADEQNKKYDLLSSAFDDYVTDFFAAKQTFCDHSEVLLTIINPPQ